MRNPVMKPFLRARETALSELGEGNQQVERGKEAGRSDCRFQD